MIDPDHPTEWEMTQLAMYMRRKNIRPKWWLKPTMYLFFFLGRLKLISPEWGANVLLAGWTWPKGVR